MNQATVLMVSGAVMFTALVISGISDMKTKRIPKACSYGILIFSLLMLIYRKEYILSLYFVFAVLAAGNKKIKPALFVMAVIVFSNKGDRAFPLVFCLAASDFLFSMRLIGGGDAQLLFSMFSFSFNSWIMAFAVASVILTAGSVYVIRTIGIKKIISRMKTVSVHLKKGTVQSDHERIKIPFAALLPFAFVLYFFVSFSKY